MAVARKKRTPPPTHPLSALSRSKVAALALARIKPSQLSISCAASAARTPAENMDAYLLILFLGRPALTRRRRRRRRRRDRLKELWAGFNHECEHLALSLQRRLVHVDLAKKRNSSRQWRPPRRQQHSTFPTAGISTRTSIAWRPDFDGIRDGIRDTDRSSAASVSIASPAAAQEATGGDAGDGGGGGGGGGGGMAYPTGETRPSLQSAADSSSNSDERRSASGARQLPSSARERSRSSKLWHSEQEDDDWVAPPSPRQSGWPSSNRQTPLPPPQSGLIAGMFGSSTAAGHRCATFADAGGGFGRSVVVGGGRHLHGHDHMDHARIAGSDRRTTRCSHARPPAKAAALRGSGLPHQSAGCPCGNFSKRALPVRSLRGERIELAPKAIDALKSLDALQGMQPSEAMATIESIGSCEDAVAALVADAQQAILDEKAAKGLEAHRVRPKSADDLVMGPGAHHRHGSKKRSHKSSGKRSPSPHKKRLASSGGGSSAAGGGGAAAGNAKGAALGSKAGASKAAAAAAAGGGGARTPPSSSSGGSGSGGSSHKNAESSTKGKSKAGGGGGGGGSPATSSKPAKKHAASTEKSGTNKSEKHEGKASAAVIAATAASLGSAPPLPLASHLHHKAVRA